MNDHGPKYPHNEQMDFSFGKHKGPWQKPKPIEKVKIGDLIIPALVHTGCTQTTVLSDLIPTLMGKPEMPINMICIHGTACTYQRKSLRLMVLGHMEEIAVGLAESLPCPMLFGTDWPHLRM